MIYFVDFDGTIIPDIKFVDDTQFHNDTMNSQIYLTKEEIDEYNNNQTYILTDRPQDDLDLVKLFCEQRVKLCVYDYLSSYGLNFINPSTRRKIILKKAALMVLNTFNNDTNQFDKCFYIDKDIQYMIDITKCYQRMIKLV